MIAEEGALIIYPHKDSQVVEGLTLIDASSMGDCFPQMELILQNLQNLTPEYLEFKIERFFCIDSFPDPARLAQYLPSMDAIAIKRKALFDSSLAGGVEALIVHEFVHVRETSESCQELRAEEILAYTEMYAFLEIYFGGASVSPTEIEKIVEINYKPDC